MYHRKEESTFLYIHVDMCASLTERGRERGGEKEREIYFFEQKLDPWKYYFDCVLTFLSSLQDKNL